MIARLRSAARAAFHMERGMMVRPVAAVLCVAFLCVPVTKSLADDVPPTPPLHDIINSELAPPSGPGWPQASDAEFLRRISLDLNGMPPSTDESRAFLNDADPAKREKLIDRLLASPLYARHMATTLDVMLMERRPNTHVPQDEWQAWLLKSVRDNKPWNVLARELMTADGDSPESRAAARFCLDRNAEPHVVTRDLGRIFFGRDMQCNQCHDSPIVSDFLQRDYHGLLAIASASYLVKKKVGDKEVTFLAERSPTDLSFESVFDKGNTHRTVARIPGMPSFTEPVLNPGEDYAIAPADGVRSVPKFSRRMMMAELATNGSNRAFNENIANRLWAMMLGRGLVHPLDMMHPDNPAASPKLLKQLGERFASSGFDMKQFLREIALSDVYQRPFDLSDDAVNHLPAAKLVHQSLVTEQDKIEVLARDAASQSSDADNTFSAAEVAMIPVAAETDAVRTQLVDAQKKVDDAQKALNDATATFNSRKTFAETLQQAVEPLNLASAALPENSELAATAKALAERSQKSMAEVPALEKAVAEKTAAVAPLNEALLTTRAAFDGARQKLQPLLETVRNEEAKVVAARAAMQEAQFAATSAKSRLLALERIAAAGEKKIAVDSTVEQTASYEASVLAANKEMTEYMPVVAARTTDMQTAEQAMTSATAAVSTAQEQVSRYRNASVTLDEAATALKKAQAALPGDEAMVSSVNTLLAKSNAAKESLKASEASLVSASQMSSAATGQMKAAQTALAEANVELKRRQDLVTQSNAALMQARESLSTARASYESAMETIPTDLSANFALSQLKPLTPEQMCWTVFKVTTVYDRYVATEAAELEKTAPLTDEQKNDAAALAARAAEIEQRVYDKLKGNIASYVQIYGGAPGQPQNDFYASPDQALFTSNGSAINSWVVPAGDNAAERIVKATDPRVAAEELYLGLLTRQPSEQEVAEVTAFLAARQDRSKAAQELAWGLVSSAEFRFNK